ncbi:MAG: outer membrane beta-barrel protein [bacterium]|nr:outer membrane beta-barrel protein [bacterium]
MRTKKSTECAFLVICAAVVALSAMPAAAQNSGSFQIEVWAGYAELDPSDLNLAVAHDNGVQEFLFDEKYQWLTGIGYIESWERTGSGERKELSRTNPLGARVKYSVNEWLAFSLGYSQFTQTEKGNVLDEYYSVPFPDFRDLERIETTPYLLSTEASAPLIGVHLRKAFSPALGVEAYLIGGPLHVEIRYEQNQSYEWLSYEAGNEIPVFSEQSLRAETGDGNGLTLEVGGRLNVRLYRRWGLFFEAGYAYQKVDTINGSGSETRNGETQTWYGEWRIRQTQLDTQWGSQTLEYPTSFPGDGPDGDASRDFEMDLSGYQLRLGVLFRF